MSLVPSLQAMWLAEDVTKDPGTGKVTVRNLFDQIALPDGETVFDAPVRLFFGISDQRPDVKLFLCFVDYSDYRVLKGREIKIYGLSPLAVTDVQVTVGATPIPHPGVYAWELHHEGEIIGRSQITATVKR